MYASKMKRAFLVLIAFTNILALLWYHRGLAQADEEPAPWDHIVSVIAGNGFTLGVRDDGRVAFAGDNFSEDIWKIADWRNIERIEVFIDSFSYIVGYEYNGGVRLASLLRPDIDPDWVTKRWTEDDFSGWDSIRQMIIRDHLCAGLRKDGTVVAMGDSLSEENLTSISEWNDIVQITTCIGIDLIGVRSDGLIETVNPYNVDPDVEWDNIAEIQIGCIPDNAAIPIGLKKDGTVVGIYRGMKDEFDHNYFFEPEESGWTNITKLYPTDYELFALRSDGRICLYNSEYLMDEGYEYHHSSSFEVTTWTDVVQFDLDQSRSLLPAALRKDGTVITVTNNTAGRETGSWTDVRKIIGLGKLLIGIKKDDTVLITGHPETEYEEQIIHEIQNWKNIKEISVPALWWYQDGHHIAALRNDGTVVAAGDNSMGAFDFTYPASDIKENTSITSTGSADPGEREESTGGQQLVREGACGPNLTWHLDKDGVLTINGEGSMDDYDSYYNRNQMPWELLREEINSVIVEGAEMVGSHAFYGCINLTEVVLADTVKTIGKGSFGGCSSLKAISFPAGLERIEADAFSNCSALQEFWLPDTVTVIPNRAFYGCRSLESLHLPDGLKIIGAGAFARCSSLQDIELPQNVTEIGNFAFYRCSAMKEMLLPTETKVIGKGAFLCCWSLKSIVMPEHLESLGEAAFSDCICLSETIVPEGICNIESFTFRGCKSLQSVTLPQSMESIAETAFMDCSNLQKVFYAGNGQWTKWKDHPFVTDYAEERCEYFDAAEQMLEG